MGFNPQELSDFARHYGFHYDDCDAFALVKDVLADMERGLEGKSSSLPMLPSHIFPVARVPAGKTVLAMDAGGSNLRAALVHFTEDGQAVAEGTQKTFMPGSKGRVSSGEFFDALADLALPLLREKKVEGIGFTFSYPMEAVENADGIPLSFSKEIDAPEVIGKPVGQGLRQALAAKGFDYSGNIVLLNDTAATLLCGYVSINADGGAEKSKNAYGFAGAPVIGFILGTGFNTAYPETKIPKIGFNSPDSPQIVVCETGNFNVRYCGQLDREFDSTTQNPGTYTLEKTASGAYLGPLTLYILKQAVRDGVLRFKKSDDLLAMPLLGTRTLNEFLKAPLSGEGPLGALFGLDEGDALAGAQYIASIITERGALFSAAVLAASVERLQFNMKPYLPVRIAVDGTTYLAFKGMRRAIDAQLHRLLFREKPRPYIISPVEQASLLGAAVAAICKA
ncbi:MAG: hexokinase [Spirochaetes bacterium]|nr:hexokinase [Spirochaetota bacterium]